MSELMKGKKMAEEGKIIPKVWGEEEYITNLPQYCSKFLYVAPGFVCSVHRHRDKTETFHVLVGDGVIQVGANVRRVQVGETVHVGAGEWHCFATLAGMTLLEISTHHADLDCERMIDSHQLREDGDGKLLAALRSS